MVDLIGIAAGIFIFASLTFKCLSVKSNIIMRVINTVGSALFVAYGAVLWATGGDGWSLVVCNSLLVCFNIYHIIKLALTLKKQHAQGDTQALQTEQADDKQAVGQDNAAENADTALLLKVKDLANKCETMDEFRAALHDVGA